MELTRIPYNAVSKELQLSLLLQIADYSVALVRMKGADSSTFQVIGSGTLVRKGNIQGVLTAHHVLHALKPPVEVAAHSEWRLFLFIKGNRLLEFSPLDFCEEEIGAPIGEYSENGPDLTFLRFAVSRPKATLDAICSYYPLEKPAGEVLKEFGVDRCCIIHTGFPEAKFEVEKSADQVTVKNLTLYGGQSGLLQEDIRQGSDGWDYLASPCDYGRFPQLPQSYGGMSGGGIWSAILKKNEAGELKFLKFALVGVNFWQRYPEDGIGGLRGHFVRSIYERAWRNRNLL